MQTSSAQDDNHDFEMSLRDQLIAAQNGQSSAQQLAAQGPEQHYPPPPPPPTAQHTARPHEQQHHNHHHHHPNLDPSIGGQHISPYAMPPTEPSPEEQDGTPAAKKAAAKAQRELSTTKRAAQNRAAQRAFRQRKEQYIGKLEEEVKNYRGLEGDFRTLQADNTSLRNYIMELQGKLSEAKIAFPPAPQTARVALPNPVVYDLGEPSVPQDAALNEQHPRFPAQMSPESHRYHPDMLQESQQYQTRPHQQHQQQHPEPVQQQPPSDRNQTHQSSPEQQTHHQPRAASMTAEAPSDAALPRSAVDQLRAAAAQAGELDNARSSRGSGSSSSGSGSSGSGSGSGMPEGYAPANDRPLKRARLEEAESRGTAAGGILAGLVSRITGMTGTKA